MAKKIMRKGNFCIAMEYKCAKLVKKCHDFTPFASYLIAHYDFTMAVCNRGFKFLRPMDIVVAIDYFLK